MTAAAFLLGVAGQYRMPLVLCLGAGTSQGSHSGISPLAMQLQALSGTRGFACVTGAGNESGFRHHYLGKLAPDQKYEDVELRVADSTSGFSMELWADASEVYTLGFISPSGEVIERVPMSVGEENTFSFKLDASSIFISYQITESSSGRFLAFLRFTAPAPGIWHIRVYPTLLVSGQFHIWLPMQGFLTEDTGFLRPDPDITITDPGNAPLLLTVSTYNHVTRHPLHPQQPRLHRHRTDQAGPCCPRRQRARTGDFARHFPPCPADRQRRP